MFLSLHLRKEKPSPNLESEIDEYNAIRNRRRRMFPKAALVGLLSGLAASLFGFVLSLAEQLRSNLLLFAHQNMQYGWIIPLLYGAAGAAASLLLVRKFAPEAGGSGIPHLKIVLNRLRPLKWKRLLPIKFISGTLSLGCGLLLGKEGPTVQIGGAVGGAVADKLALLPKERRTLIAAGAGAGLAAAFNAPLSGLAFVLEEVQHDFQPIVFASALVASMVANIVARYFNGNNPVFAIPGYATPPLTSLPFFCLLGILIGFLGVLFNKSLMAVLKGFSRLDGVRVPLGAASIGALVGLVSWFSPLLAGGGHLVAENAMAGDLALKAIPLLFLIRFILTVGSYGTGVAGGIFAPLLALGAIAGLGVGQLAHTWYPVAVPQPAVFAVVGMAAMFTAIVRAPLTGILLIVEMTGNYAQMVPLLVACFFAYDVADLLKDRPIYEALMERDLARSGAHFNLKKPAVMEFEVESDCPFDGKEVQSLGLPPGCVIVGCSKDGVEVVPTAHTCLEAHMKLIVAIDAKAADSANQIFNGCKAL